MFKRIVSDHFTERAVTHPLSPPSSLRHRQRRTRTILYTLPWSRKSTADERFTLAGGISFHDDLQPQVLTITRSRLTFSASAVSCTYRILHAWYGTIPYTAVLGSRPPRRTSSYPYQPLCNLRIIVQNWQLSCPQTGQLPHLSALDRSTMYE